jgi:hypothetical protein
MAPKSETTNSLPLYDMFIHTLPPVTASTEVVDEYLVRWYTGDHPSEPSSAHWSFDGGYIDGEKLCRLTAGALQSIPKQNGFPAKESRMIATDVQEAKKADKKYAEKVCIYAIHTMNQEANDFGAQQKRRGMAMAMGLLSAGTVAAAGLFFMVLFRQQIERFIAK